jgi:hypothetical protein
MLSVNFRPWGELEWLLKKLNTNKWYYVGCLSTEDRCLSCLSILLKNNYVRESLFIEVVDPVSLEEKVIKSKIAKNKNKLASITTNFEIETFNLICDDYEIVGIADSIISSGHRSIIFDITSFPKRFFFPILKLLSRNPIISNILVTYTKAESYSSSDLSDDPEPWYPLPLFRPEDFPEPKYELAFVGTGFMPFSLPKLLKDNHSEISLRLFFPFPPGPPNYQRSWEFIRKIEKHYVLKEVDEIARVNSTDVNETFDYIETASENGDKKCLFAPYGPKPISLAMCLWAIKNNAPVYYTQPKFYNPDYSVGAKETLAYLVRFNNQEYYD